jgi:hypothetical protein
MSLLLFISFQLAPASWREIAVLSAPEAVQAAAADGSFVYAINNTTVAKYDRETGQRIATSRGRATHLNSGFFHHGKLYCAHSNYPNKPERSEIFVLDTESMVLETFHDFGESPHGSLTWAIHDGHDWWCNFAHYGDDNDRTVLVRYDEQWRETGIWRYPAELISQLGRYSVSGGVWRNGELLVTGHDARELYRLRLPPAGDEPLEYLGAIPAPFTGQGIAADPVTGGLVGISRAKRRIVFAEP